MPWIARGGLKTVGTWLHNSKTFGQPCAHSSFNIKYKGAELRNSIYTRHKCAENYGGGKGTVPLRAYINHRSL